MLSSRLSHPLWIIFRYTGVLNLVFVSSNYHLLSSTVGLPDNPLSRKPNAIQVKMGTRGLLGFIIRGQRHSAHNQYDSYPEGLGKEIVEFILSLTPEDYSTMAHLVAEINWVKWRSKPSLELQERYQKLGFADLSEGSRRPGDWYCLLRKTQGAPALPAIQSGELKHMLESSKFSMKICL
jgi:hypothetical protein